MCDDCGTQAFARGEAACAALRKKMKPISAPKQKEPPLTPAAADAQLDKPWFFR
jgi:hypothetical protein